MVVVKTKILGSKYEALMMLEEFLALNNTKDIRRFALNFCHSFLQTKIRFPVLENISEKLYNILPERKRKIFLDHVIEARTIGGNVVAGKFLQLGLIADYEGALKKAGAYILFGDAWYVCDIIGERVMGHALLTMPKETLAKLKIYPRHDNKWMVRCAGVATHYAVKKGLAKKHAAQAYQLLLSCADASEFHTKKGIGWAAKTVAKFHPDIIQKYKIHLENDRVKQWFKSKVKIGLSRSFKYASRNNS